jgi:hypothetical protein
MWCTTLGITGFLDFKHHLIFKRMENTAFQKMDVSAFMQAEEDSYTFGSTRRLVLSKGTD